MDPEHGETFPWDEEKLAAKIYLLVSHMATRGQGRFVCPWTNDSDPLTSTLVLGGIVCEVVAAVVGDGDQVPGHRAGHHQQPRARYRAREIHVGPAQAIDI